MSKGFLCKKCGASFRDSYAFGRHEARKTPCDPIIDAPPDTDDKTVIRCKYCGREFASKHSLSRHVRHRCKIANSDEGMEKLMDHTLQRQMAEQRQATDELRAQITELTSLLKSQAIVPQQSASVIVNGPADQRVGQQFNIGKVEIRPWDSARAISVDIAEIAAAFAENARLQEYARLPEHSLTDPDIAPPYVTELFTDLVRRGHTDPAARNIYLNPRRADQVLVQLKGGTWEVKTALEGCRALLDGVATSVQEVTLAYEKRKQLPTEAQNALATAGLLYDEEPEAYVKRAKASLAAHLTNLAPLGTMTKQ